MSEVVSRVAQAIRPFMANPREGEPEQAARHAIEALLEPTQRMAYVGSWAIGPGGHAETERKANAAFKAMLETVLAGRS